MNYTLTIPQGYRPIIGVKETERAIKSLKDFFAGVDTANAAITDCKIKMTMDMDMDMTGFGIIKVNAAS
ncbi:MAG: hypothetical protein N3G20_02115, partial [Verrucomicrobiae bacterium]|nr:hypothetical protein [Verrucomicrobiae bacterium]